MGAESFCCCFSIESGTKIIGVICTIFSLFAVLTLGTYIFTDYDDLNKQISENKDVQAELAESASSAKFIAALFLVVVLALLVTSILLVKGAVRQSPSQMRPFLVVLIGTIIVTIITIGFCWKSGNNSFFLFLILFLGLYFLYTTWSLFMEYRKLEIDDNVYGPQQPQHEYEENSFKNTFPQQPPMYQEQGPAYPMQHNPNPYPLQQPAYQQPQEPAYSPQQPAYPPQDNQYSMPMPMPMPTPQQQAQPYPPPYSNQGSNLPYPN